MKILFIEPGSPWENGFNRSFNGQLLDCEVFATQQEAKVLLERWCWHCNQVRPPSRPGYRPPAPGARTP